VHVARGKLAANGQSLAAGDALKATEVEEIVLERGEQAEVLLFDLP
jgi:quercetin 2,3-dioxygenase